MREREGKTGWSYDREIPSTTTTQVKSFKGSTMAMKLNSTEISRKLSLKFPISHQHIWSSTEYRQKMEIE